MKKYSGFTLIELLIVVGMIGVLMAFGLPAMGAFIKNDRLSTQINALVGHMAYARSEAVLRRQQVALCASSDLSSCSNAASWSDGWLIFVDANGDSVQTNDEEVLRVKQPLSGGNTLTSTIGTMFIYDSSGFSAAGTGTFSLCDDRGTAFMKSISISNTGRVRQGGGVAC
jgi:type IV fimbrial biogenesis protein FimT